MLPAHFVSAILTGPAAQITNLFKNRTIGLSVLSGLRVIGEGLVISQKLMTDYLAVALYLLAGLAFAVVPIMISHFVVKRSSEGCVTRHTKAEWKQSEAPGFNSRSPTTFTR